MIINFKNVEKTYSADTTMVYACKNINFSVEKGRYFNVAMLLILNHTPEEKVKILRPATAAGLQWTES